jgi:hypothetical protein
MQIRPRFREHSPSPPAEILDGLKNALSSTEEAIEGTTLSNYFILRIAEPENHFWSPRLTVHVDPEESGSELRGLFAPAPAVWTMFAGLYAVSLFAILIGLVWGGAQWQLDMPPSGFWLAAIGCVLFAASYAIAYIGQQLGQSQIIMLKQFLADHLDIK